ncbi:hypothetical protein GCM10027445_38890 [Amycolatopsis endophytica]|uniref:Uncharacterized protein n=1 Tax=Amycolatopsis endophytica TaxID=860233 RepID=A0A853AZM1_9PSEU|nr:hypothetical protein [Amycolatopsis endophytica]NYI88253.1 hypothetical protein [Amycolatopsis endophytica]
MLLGRAAVRHPRMGADQRLVPPARLVLECPMRISDPGEPVAARRRLVLASVAGFALGAGLIGVLWASSTAVSGPTADARAACDALSRAGPLPEGRIGRGTLEPGVLQHIMAADQLASAAAEVSSAYDDLADRIDGVRRMALSLNFADPNGRRDLADARELCDTI